MKNIILFLGILSGLLLISCGKQEAIKEEQKVENTKTVSEEVEKPGLKAKQLLVVTTAGWDIFQGELRRFIRKGTAWEEVGETIPIVTGKNGLAWGSGIEDYTSEGPAKKEGDKRSPAGIFELDHAFGYAAADDAGFVKASYVSIDEQIMCIEDTGSVHYNKVLDAETVESDWTSTDRMLRKDDLYEWGMVVAHNYAEPQAGGGSCIFLHVWRAPDKGTAGCTAMDKSDIKELLSWIDPAQSPHLVQIPEAFYPQFQKKYGLPKL